MANVLNLKNTQVEPQEIVAEEVPETISSAGTPSATDEVFVERVSWEASIRPDVLERRKEHIMLGILGSIGVAVALFTDNLLLVVIVGLVVFSWEMHYRFGSHEVRVDVNPEGVRFNGHAYPHARLDSFSVRRFPDGNWHLSIRQRGPMSPILRAPLGDTDQEEVRTVLSQYLLEEEHPVPFSELFLKS